MPQQPTENPKPDWVIPGHRARLKPFEDQPEQFGTIQGFMIGDSTCVVLLDEKYIDHDEDDDGIREVPYDQMEPG